MIKYDGSYSPYYSAPDERYPEGSAIDATSNDSYNGTPYKKDFFNDVIGFMQAIFHKAFGNPFSAGGEVERNISGNPENAMRSDVVDALEKIIGDQTGDLSGLDTTEKSNLVEAVNEVNTKSDDNTTAIGDLSGLDTTEKSNLVEAVNEVKSYADENKDWATTAGLYGRNLVEVLGVSTVAQAAAALKTKSDSKDYSGLRLGDYLEITMTYGEYGSITAKYEIASIGQYHWFRNSANTADQWDLGNIVFLCEKAIFSRQIGASTAQRMYFTSPMNSFLTGTIAPALESALGITLKRPILYQQYNSGSYDSPEWNTDPNDWEDDDSQKYAAPKMFLPSIRELTGEHGWSCEFYDNSHQFPLLANAPEKIPAKDTNGSYDWYWSRSPSRYPGGFCVVGSGGGSYSGSAYFSYGVRPAFCL